VSVARRDTNGRRVVTMRVAGGMTIGAFLTAFGAALPALKFLGVPSVGDFHALKEQVAKSAQAVDVNKSLVEIRDDVNDLSAKIDLIALEQGQRDRALLTLLSDFGISEEERTKRLRRLRDGG